MRLEFFSPSAAPPELRQLFETSSRPEGTWAWFETLAFTTINQNENATIASLVDGDGRFVSAVPLVRGHTVRGLTAPYSTFFQPPLREPEQAALLGRLLAPRIDGVLRLDCLDADDVSMSAFLRGLSQGGAALAVYEHFANWFEEIAEFSAYWGARGSRLKSTIKRKTSVAVREGHIGFECVDLTGDWQGGAAHYQSIYAKSWKSPEPHAGFIEALLKNLGASGTARLGIARINGNPAAAQIWLVQSPYATIFKLAQDPEFDKYSTGSLLTHWLLKEFCEKEGIHHVDFGRGDDAYKKDWLRHRRSRQGVVAANLRTTRGLVSLAFEIVPTKVSYFLHETLSRPAADK